MMNIRLTEPIITPIRDIEGIHKLDNQQDGEDSRQAFPGGLLRQPKQSEEKDEQQKAKEEDVVEVSEQYKQERNVKTTNHAFSEDIVDDLASEPEDTTSQYKHVDIEA